MGGARLQCCLPGGNLVNAYARCALRTVPGAHVDKGRLADEVGSIERVVAPIQAVVRPDSRIASTSVCCWMRNGRKANSRKRMEPYRRFVVRSANITPGRDRRTGTGSTGSASDNYPVRGGHVARGGHRELGLVVDLSDHQGDKSALEDAIRKALEDVLLGRSLSPDITKRMKFQPLR
jgi:hypothetical protein